MKRRTFLGSMAAAGLAGAASPYQCRAETASTKPGAGALTKRTLGKTGIEVSALVLGGVVAMQEKPTTAFHPAELADAALDAGITYFDTAAGYGGGQSERNYGEVLSTRRREVFLATKTQKRTYDEAMRDVEGSLARLRTDHVDLLQLHGVRADEDCAQWDGLDGVLKAFYKLRDEKVTRFIGVTGHDAAEAMCRAISMYEFDTILTTFNPTEERRPFREQVIPLANSKGMGILAMKLIGGGNGALAIGNPLKNDGVPRHDDAPRQAEARELIRYGLGLPISAAVVGMASLEHLRVNVAAVRDWPPLNAEEMDRLERYMMVS